MSRFWGNPEGIVCPALGSVPGVYIQFLRDYYHSFYLGYKHEIPSGLLGEFASWAIEGDLINPEGILCL